MSKSSRLIFFGTDDFSLPSLKALVEAGFNVAAVVTKPDSARGRSKQLVPPAVKIYAKSHDIPVLQPERVSEITAQLENLKPNAGILVSYGKILPKRTLNVFSEIGIINIHPSLLPKYRGPAPIEAAILHGDNETGISIMRLTEGMDEGPVFAQALVPLTGGETRIDLAATLADASAQFLIKALPDILENNLKALPQKNSDVSYTSLIKKTDGILDPTTDTAHALERKVRAYLGFPKTRLQIKNTDVIITSVNVIESLASGKLVIPCKDNTYLEVLELIAPSGKTMSGEAFLRGYAD